MKKLNLKISQFQILNSPDLLNFTFLEKFQLLIGKTPKKLDADEILKQLEEDQEKIELKEFKNIDFEAATNIVKSYNWKQELDKLRTTIDANEELDIYNIHAPGFMFHNEKNDAIINFRCYDENDFEVGFELIDDEEELESYNVGEKQIEELVKLFYKQNYQEIKKRMEWHKGEKSRTRKELEVRYDKKEEASDKKEGRFGEALSYVYAILVIGIFIYLWNLLWSFLI